MQNTGRFIYSGSKDCADMLYLSGFLAEDPFLWFEVNGRSYIIVSPMEIERARKQCRKDVTPLTPAQAASEWALGGAKPRLSNILAAVARKERVWKWEVNPECQFGFIENLLRTRLGSLGRSRTRTGGRITVAQKEGFCPERDVKSRDEAEAIRQSERIAEAGLARGIQLLRESSIGDDGFLKIGGEPLTAEMLKGEVNAEIARHNGTASGTICAAGKLGADPHQTGTGPIPANSPIVFDIFPRGDESGYFGDLSRTVLKGKAPQIVKKAFTAVHDAQRRAIEMLKPGVPCKDVHCKAAEVMESYGFKTDLKTEKPFGFIHSLGHGVGLDIHERPNLSPRSTAVLAAGNVVTVEPGLYYPEWGGIRIEDTLLVTVDGYDDLATADVFLEIE